MKLTTVLFVFGFLLDVKGTTHFRQLLASSCATRLRIELYYMMGSLDTSKTQH
jgi:hypothetical protein